MRFNLTDHVELLACDLAIVALNRSALVRALIRILLTGSYRNKEWLWVAGLITCGLFGFAIGFGLVIILG